MASSYGIKASQKGYDVRTASDSQLLFSSSWPLLKIEAQGPFVITDVESPTEQILATHNLGYKPFFLIFDTTSGDSHMVGPGFSATGTSQGYGENFMVSNTKLSYFGFTILGVPSTMTGYFYIFRLDFTTNYTAPILNQTDSSAVVIDNYGIKVSKEGKSINSTDMRDFVIHSSTRSPMIHQVVAGPLASNGVDYSLVATHGLAYAPLWLAFKTPSLTVYPSSAGFYQQFFGGNGGQIIIANATSVTLKSSTAGINGAIVIFKDPFSV